MAVKEDMPTFPAMRRKKQLLPDAETREILARNTHGVLALSGGLGERDYPYAVPLSYVYDGGETIYFHCAKAGHKIDLLFLCDRVSFCVVDADDVVPELFSTRYRSAVVFGRICRVEEETEVRQVLGLLSDKYSPTDIVPMETRNAEIAAGLSGVCILALHIDAVTGKQSRAMAEERERSATENN